MRPVVSEEGEQAVMRVMSTLARGRARPAPGALEGRLFGRRAVLLDDPQHYLVLPHFASVAEEYSRRMLVACSAPLITLDHPFREVLWAHAERDAEGTWGAQTTAWQTWHGVDVAAAPAYERLRGVIEARNAIMHGLGELTNKQVRKNGGAKAIASLAQIGVSVSGRRLVITPGSVVACASASKDFIEWLDLELQAKSLI